MKSLAAFYHSTVGKKVIMAATGLIGIGFLVAHVAGNLQLFLGRDKFNAYSAMLHGPAAELVLLARVVLVVAVILHVMMAVQLTARSRAARPVGYKRKESQAATLASRTMAIGGLFLLLFIVFHILHFTTLDVDPAGWRGVQDTAGRTDIYGNVVASFQIPWVAALYVAAMVVIGLHLFHGAWSSVRTLGHARPSVQPLRRTVAAGLAVVLWIGFTSLPVAVFFGLVR
jgi:succinate dehydrogenase / fumarate reductase, cytochrome b subunit